MSHPEYVLIMIVGPSGSGKSQLANRIVPTKYICEADSYPNLYQHGIIVAPLLSKAHAFCKHNVETFMKQQTPLIVQSNTNLDLGEKGVLPYLRMAHTYGYKIKWILPAHGLLHFSMDNSSYLDQLDFLCNVRSSGDKKIPRHNIIKMVHSYHKIKEKLLLLSTMSDPYYMIEFLKK